MAAPLTFFIKRWPKMGIEFTFISPESTEEEIHQAFKENTRCVFAETLANPSLVVTDLELFAKGSSCS